MRLLTVTKAVLSTSTSSAASTQVIIINTGDGNIIMGEKVTTDFLVVVAL